jgi:hypothetical protein
MGELKSFLLALQCPGLLYDAFKRHSQGRRYVQLFTQIVPVLFGLDERLSVPEHCLDILIISSESDALQLLQVLFQVLGDPTLANSLSRSLIDLALTVESSDIRKEIFERVLPMKTPAAKAFIEELVSFQGTAKPRRDWARRGALPLIASGDIVTTALVQLSYHSPIFGNAVFRPHSDHPFVECLRWCYPRMQTGKRTSVDVTGEFPDISIYAEHFPNVVAIVDQTEKIKVAEFDAPVLMTSLPGCGHATSSI